jgi:NAD(P)-dependent dehydrogenase (short-subunit alcohol dehydrogenase family)
MKKVALITGGTRGIGLGISEKFAENGYDLAVCASSPAEKYRDTIEALKKYGGRVMYCQCDISDRASREAMLEQISTEYPVIHVLINNAGVAPKIRADILDASEESFAELLKINLQGPYFLTQAVAKRMIEAGKTDPEFEAVIINIGSISATVASVSRGEYCISKAGVAMSSRLWAVRLAEYGIPVYELRPGVIRTDMTSAVTEKYDRLIHDGLCLQKRWGMPEDIGKAALMLAQGALAYSTGQVINIDGGMEISRL